MPEALRGWRGLEVGEALQRGGGCRKWDSGEVRQKGLLTGCVTQLTIAERWRYVAGKLSLARAGRGKHGKAEARRQQVKQSRRR